MMAPFVLKFRTVDLDQLTPFLRGLRSVIDEMLGSRDLRVWLLGLALLRRTPQNLDALTTSGRRSEAV